MHCHGNTTVVNPNICCECWHQHAWSASAEITVSVVNDVNFRMVSKYLKQESRKNMNNHGKLMIRRHSCAHTQTVDMCLGTRRAVCLTSVQNMVEFMVVISLLDCSAALWTVDVLSIPVLLWQGTRNVHMGLCHCLMQIMHNLMMFLVLLHYLMWDFLFIVLVGIFVCASTFWYCEQTPSEHTVSCIVWVCGLSICLVFILILASSPCIPSDVVHGEQYLGFLLLKHVSICSTFISL